MVKGVTHPAWNVTLPSCCETPLQQLAWQPTMLLPAPPLQDATRFETHACDKHTPKMPAFMGYQ
jgi:hypothetical protein